MPRSKPAAAAIASAYATEAATPRKRKPRAKRAPTPCPRCAPKPYLAPEWTFALGPAAHLLVTLPIRTVSEMNAREHWSKATKRKQQQSGIVEAVFGRIPLVTETLRSWAPLTVTLTRVAPMRMDCDNSVISMKRVRDSIAKVIGIDDGDDRLTWVYEREIAKAYGVRVTIAPRGRIETTAAPKGEGVAT